MPITHTATSKRNPSVDSLIAVCPIRQSAAPSTAQKMTTYHKDDYKQQKLFYCAIALSVLGNTHAVRLLCSVTLRVLQTKNI